MSKLRIISASAEEQSLKV